MLVWYVFRIIDRRKQNGYLVDLCTQMGLWDSTEDLARLRVTALRQATDIHRSKWLYRIGQETIKANEPGRSVTLPVSTKLQEDTKGAYIAGAIKNGYEFNILFRWQEKEGA